jgi:hypothetical protein
MARTLRSICVETELRTGPDGFLIAYSLMRMGAPEADLLAFRLQVSWHLSLYEPTEPSMPNAARSLQPDTARPNPDDNLGAEETQVTATAPVEGRPSPEQIAREAYLIYLANGGQDGRHEEDWYQAEQRLGLSSGARQASSTPQQAVAQLDEVDTRDRTPG